MSRRCPFSSRRGFLAAAGGLLATAGSGLGAQAATDAVPTGQGPGRNLIEPFWGEHQDGIATPSQNQIYFAAFDLAATKASDVVRLLRNWTEATARLTAGQTAAPLGADSLDAGSR